MIRDPSDGTVRENQPKPLEAKPYASEKPVLEITSSGLPAGSAKPEQIERLNESRKWLKDYHANKASGATDGQ